MKHLSLFILFLSASLTAAAQGGGVNTGIDTTMKAVTGIRSPAAKADSTKKKIYDKPPEFPGGYAGLSRYISRKIKYPPVAQLIGIDGKVFVTFWVDPNGKVVDVKPLKCIGAGCEAEAVDLLEQSPLWKPGELNGAPVKVQYTLPIVFKMGDYGDLVTMKALRKSGYGFIFQIKGKVYNINEAETLIGSTFKSGQVEEAVPYASSGLHAIKGKETYILVMKDI